MSKGRVQHYFASRDELLDFTAEHLIDRVTQRMQAAVARAPDALTAVRNALSHTADDRYALARVTIGEGHDTAAFDRILNGDGVPTAGPRQKLRTLVWRQARRLQRPMVAGW